MSTDDEYITLGCDHDWTEWAYDEFYAASSGVGTAESRECLKCGKVQVD